MTISLADARVSEQGIDAVAEVLRSGQLIAGAHCSAFERELAEYLDVAHVVVVSSGTAALHLAVLALGIGPGDAVLVPDFTFPATANAVALSGARPVIVDVEADSYNMSPEALSETIRRWQGPERLVAVIPVHQFGLCADMTQISVIASRHQLRVIEDAACALGARFGGRPAGTLGDVGCFSFHPRKCITTGEGGAITTRSPDTASRLRRLRAHGMERTDSGMSFAEPGLNYRLTDFQCALGRVQLAGLDAGIARRQSVAAQYSSAWAALVGHGLERLPASSNEVWQTFMVVLDEAIDRAAVVKLLRDKGVEANVGAHSLTKLGLYPPGPLTLFEAGPRLHERGLALPCHASLPDADVEQVMQALPAVLQ